MRRVRRHVALGYIALVVGALALSGCVTTESAYDETYGGSSYLGYDPYWTPPLEYRQGYPGYYAYPRYYVYSPGYYSYHRYYGPTVYPPPPGHARRDRDRDDARDRHPGDRSPRDGDDRYAGHRFDRDRDDGGNGDRNRRGSRRPPPQFVPTESPGDDAPTPRRRGRQEPAQEVPE